MSGDPGRKLQEPSELQRYLFSNGGGEAKGVSQVGLIYSLQNKRGTWPSGYIMTRMHSAVSDLSCYIIIYLQNVGRESLTIATLANLLFPYREFQFQLLSSDFKG